MTLSKDLNTAFAEITKFLNDDPETNIFQAILRDPETTQTTTVYCRKNEILRLLAIVSRTEMTQPISIEPFEGAYIIGIPFHKGVIRRPGTYELQGTKLSPL